MSIPAIALLMLAMLAAAVTVDSALVAADELHSLEERRNAGQAATFMGIATGVLGSLVWLNF
jgi:hypothetical protein